MEQSDLQNFDVEPIPEQYTRNQNGFKVEAFPGLSVTKHQGKTQVDVELFTNARDAIAAHRSGLIALIKKNVPSPIKYLQSKLPNKAKLSLYFNPFGKIELLIEDIVDASIDALIDKKGGANSIRDKDSFSKVCEFVRAQLNETALQIAQQIEQGLSTANQIQKQCKGSIPLNRLEQIGHIKSHLDQLVFKGFVFKTGTQNLANWNRYLKGLLQRCEKLKVDTNRDRINQLQIDKVVNAYQQISKDLTNQHKDLTALVEIQEMIEEFRISLFAQQLGTAYPISAKRITNKLNEVQNNS